MLLLRPSPIHGIGVFTTAPIARGERLDLWDGDDWRLVDDAEAEADAAVRALRDIYCVRVGGGYMCPLAFNRMSIGWYMNHSDDPNAWSSPALNFEYYASRDISPGEEILCDYRRLSSDEGPPGGERRA
jgi:SET domain-containing protein